MIDDIGLMGKMVDDIGLIPKKQGMVDDLGLMGGKPSLGQQVSTALNLPDLYAAAKGVTAPITEGLPRLGEDIAALTHDPREVYQRYREGLGNLDVGQAATEAASFVTSPLGLDVGKLVQEPRQALADIPQNVQQNVLQRPWSTALNVAMLGGMAKSAAQPKPVLTERALATEFTPEPKPVKPTITPTAKQRPVTRKAPEPIDLEAEYSKLLEQARTVKPNTPEGEALRARLEDNRLQAMMLNEKPAAASVDAIPEQGKINGITREEAGRWAEEGKPINEHILEGIDKHGVDKVENAILNEIKDRVLASELVGDTAKVENLYKTEAQIRDVISRERTKPKSQPTLNERGSIGFPSEEPLRTPTTPASESVARMYDKTRLDIKQKNKTTPKQIIHKLGGRIWDVSSGVKEELLAKGGEEGRRAARQHDLIAGAPTKAGREFEAAVNRIYDPLTTAEKNTLDEVIQSRRTVAIDTARQDLVSGQLGTEIKHPGGLTGKQHAEFLRDINPEVRDKLNAAADEYFAETRRALDLLHDEGLVGDADYAKLVASGDYSPRRFLQHIDPERVGFDKQGRKISVPDSGLERLDTGSINSMEIDSSSLLSQVLARTHSRIFRNKANRELYALAEQHPNNGVVQLAEIERYDAKGNPVYKPAPAGMEKVSVVIKEQLPNGETVARHREMLMPDEMAKGWVMSDPAINQALGETIGWLSGAKILRPMATGLNPEFVITNVPRDMAHIFLTTEEYSAHLPKQIPQMATDIAAVAKDAFTRKGRYNDYINEGGGMEFLTTQARFKPGIKELKQLQNVLAYVGETSEIITRLALRERALKNGRSPADATHIARNYLDFSQGGTWTKAMDKGIPYLNASVQGTRGLVRAARRNPKLFAYKMGQIGLLSMGLYLANKNQNPEALAEVSPRDKVNNFIITTPFTYTDDSGDKRHLYFKIAKDQGQRAVSTLFESLAAKVMGESVDGEQISQSINDAFPIIPGQELPPTLDALVGYTANKDFWKNEDIWRGPEVEPQEEYTRYTHPGFIEAGRLTGMSPERLKYSLQQVFTYGNIYTSVVGAAMNEILGEMDVPERDKMMEQMIADAPFLRRVGEWTKPYDKYQKTLKEARVSNDTRTYVQNRAIDTIMERVMSGKADISEARNYIKDSALTDQKRLVKRAEDFKKIYNIPDRNWWIGMRHLSPEDRADMFYERYSKADKSEKVRLTKYARIVPGIDSDRFRARLNALAKKSNIRSAP